MSETVVGLQTQLNSLQYAASEMKVNMNKSNIIVFQKGGYLGARERWRYDGVVMLAVNVYKYLGIYFTTRLSFVSVSRSKNALVHVLQKLYLLNNNSLEVFLKLFDAQVQPNAQCGSELWGLDKAAIHIEKVHVYALKRFFRGRYDNTKRPCGWRNRQASNYVELRRQMYSLLVEAYMYG